MRKVTLCFLKDGNRICLAMKKRGFGVGKWNGIGGKVNEGETVVEAALRELAEEIGVTAQHNHIEEVGDIIFYFKGKPDWDQQMHIFFITDWSGDPRETEEVAPQWYDTDKLPYDKMWVDDPYWLPKVIEGKKIKGEFYLTKDGSEIEKFNIKEQ